MVGIAKSFPARIIVFWVALVLGCQRAPTKEVSIHPVRIESETAEQRAQYPEESKRVLLVINNASAASREIGEYYALKRQIPRSNILRIDVSTSENISESEYRHGIEQPIRTAISRIPDRIDFIVLTKGIPIRLRDNNGYSVDAFLVAMNLNISPITELKDEQVRQSMNPYFNRNEEFNSSKFGIYLVTRLEGYSVAHSKRLVDLSLSAQREEGPFFFDAAENRKSEGYIEMQQTLYRANALLQSKGFQSTIDETKEFVAPSTPLAGYASWGSNDGGFTSIAYRKLQFKPGALAETFVSTSARTFTPTDEGQSLIGDLIRQGVTGVKGYVSEPYTFALAKPDILFDRYTEGFNLAESFYMASLVVKWKDIVIGDPLCRPYRKK